MSKMSGIFADVNSLYLTIPVATSAVVALYWLWQTRSAATKRYVHARESATPPLLEKIKVPAAGALSDPAPYIDFDITKTLTRDYIYDNKPLRFPYFQTMAHQKMHIDNWIELDKDYMFYLDMKKRVIEEQGKKVIDSMPENDDGCCELLEVLVDYLPKVGPRHTAR